MGQGGWSLNKIRKPLQRKTSLLRKKKWSCFYSTQGDLGFGHYRNSDDLSQEFSPKLFFFLISEALIVHSSVLVVTIPPEKHILELTFIYFKLTALFILKIQ